MKKLILLTLAAVMMAGCNENRKTTSIVEGLKVVTIDSCEYFKRCSYGGFIYYFHKGNCRFCKERRQKELEELVIRIKGK